MSTLRTAVIQLAFDQPELREHLLPLVTAATMPRATRRPPGPKFRQKVIEWVKADAQEKLEAAGVPQARIDSMIRAVGPMGIGYEGWGGQKFQYFESQQEVIDFLNGRFDADIGGTGGMKNYPDVLNYWIEKWGGGNNAYRDKVKGLLNKMSPAQKALAHYFYLDGSWPGDRAKKLMETLESASGDDLQKWITLMEAVLKMGKLPKSKF